MSNLKVDCFINLLDVWSCHNQYVKINKHAFSSVKTCFNYRFINLMNYLPVYVRCLEM